MCNIIDTSFSLHCFCLRQNEFISLTKNSYFNNFKIYMVLFYFFSVKIFISFPEESYILSNISKA